MNLLDMFQSTVPSIVCVRIWVGEIKSPEDICICVRSKGEGAVEKIIIY